MKIPAGRRSRILEIISKEGIARVDELSSSLEVSVITIRRDLDLLEEQGLVERTHGGAMATRYFKSEQLYGEKNLENRDLKERLGRAAADLVDEGDTLFINSGSTMVQVLCALQFRKNIRIITNNIAAAHFLSHDATAEIIFLGGSYRFTSNCTIGEFAKEMISSIISSKTIIGTDGLSLKNGITSPVHQESVITRAMVDQTQGSIIAVADYTKIGRVANFKTLPLNRLDTLITNGLMDEEFKKDFHEAGVELVLIES